MPTEYRGGGEQKTETKSTGWASKAQRDKCKELVEQGKMKQADFDRKEAETQNLETLPDRIHPKK
jgi:hypothetical protein